MLVKTKYSNKSHLKSDPVNNKTSSFFSVQYGESLDACKQRLCNGNQVAANFRPENGGECGARDGCQNGLKITAFSSAYQMLYKIPEY